LRSHQLPINQIKFDNPLYLHATNNFYLVKISDSSSTHQVKILLPTRLKPVVDFVGWVSGFIA